MELLRFSPSYAGLGQVPAQFGLNARNLAFDLLRYQNRDKEPKALRLVRISHAGIIFHSIRAAPLPWRRSAGCTTLPASIPIRPLSQRLECALIASSR